MTSQGLLHLFLRSIRAKRKCAHPKVTGVDYTYQLWGLRDLWSWVTPKAVYKASSICANVHSNPSVQRRRKFGFEFRLLLWCDHRLSANKSWYRPRRKLSLRAFTRMTDDLWLIHATRIQWRFSQLVNVRQNHVGRFRSAWETCIRQK